MPRQFDEVSVRSSVSRADSARRRTPERIRSSLAQPHYRTDNSRTRAEKDAQNVLNLQKAKAYPAELVNYFDIDSEAREREELLLQSLRAIDKRQYAEALRNKSKSEFGKSAANLNQKLGERLPKNERKAEYVKALLEILKKEADKDLKQVNEDDALALSEYVYELLEANDRRVQELSRPKYNPILRFNSFEDYAKSVEEDVDGEADDEGVENSKSKNKQEDKKKQKLSKEEYERLLSEFNAEVNTVKDLIHKTRTNLADAVIAPEETRLRYEDRKQEEEIERLKQELQDKEQNRRKELAVISKRLPDSEFRELYKEQVKAQLLAQLNELKEQQQALPQFTPALEAAEQKQKWKQRLLQIQRRIRQTLVDSQQMRDDSLDRDLERGKISTGNMLDSELYHHYVIQQLFAKKAEQDVTKHKLLDELKTDDDFVNFYNNFHEYLKHKKDTLESDGILDDDVDEYVDEYTETLRNYQEDDESKPNYSPINKILSDGREAIGKALNSGDLSQIKAAAKQWVPVFKEVEENKHNYIWPYVAPPRVHGKIVANPAQPNKAILTADLLEKGEFALDQDTKDALFYYKNFNNYSQLPPKTTFRSLMQQSVDALEDLKENAKVDPIKIIEPGKSNDDFEHNLHSASEKQEEPGLKEKIDEERKRQIEQLKNLDVKPPVKAQIFEQFLPQYKPHLDQYDVAYPEAVKKSLKNALVADYINKLLPLSERTEEEAQEAYENELQRLQEEINQKQAILQDKRNQQASRDQENSKKETIPFLEDRMDELQARFRNEDAEHTVAQQDLEELYQSLAQEQARHRKNATDRLQEQIDYLKDQYLDFSRKVESPQSVMEARRLGGKDFYQQFDKIQERKNKNIEQEYLKAIVPWKLKLDDAQHEIMRGNIADQVGLISNKLEYTNAINRRHQDYAQQQMYLTQLRNNEIHKANQAREALADAQTLPEKKRQLQRAEETWANEKDEKQRDHLYKHYMMLNNQFKQAESLLHQKQQASLGIHAADSRYKSNVTNADMDAWEAAQNHDRVMGGAQLGTQFASYLGR